MSKTFINMPCVAFRVPSKGALPPCCLHRPPNERDAPFTECPLTLSKSPVNETPLQVLLWREMSVSRDVLYISFRTTVKEPSLHFPLAELSLTDAPFPVPSCIWLSNSPVKQSPFQVLQSVPTGVRCLLYIYHGVPNEQGLPVQQNLIFLSKSLVKPPIPTPTLHSSGGPLWRRSFSRANGLFIH